jgi:hypothetical protein
MRRIEARRKKASDLRLRFSQSLASLRQRLSQAMVRSTIQRLDRILKPIATSGRLTISTSRCGRSFASALLNCGPLPSCACLTILLRNIWCFRRRRSGRNPSAGSGPRAGLPSRSPHVAAYRHSPTTPTRFGDAAPVIGGNLFSNIPGEAMRPRSASKRDPFVLRFERLALAPSELVGVAETARARVVM